MKYSPPSKNHATGPLALRPEAWRVPAGFLYISDEGPMYLRVREPPQWVEKPQPPETEIISAEEIADAIDPLKQDAVLQASLKACRLCGGVGLTSIYGPKPCPACGAGGPRRRSVCDVQPTQGFGPIANRPPARAVPAGFTYFAEEGGVYVSIGNPPEWKSKTDDNIREMVEAVREVWNQHKKTEDRIMRLMARIEELAGVPINSILRNP